MSEPSTFRVLYFGLLAEKRGRSDEQISSSMKTVSDLYAELDGKHGLSLKPENFRAAVNDEFVAWDAGIVSGDVVAFLPPMSGG